MTKLSTWTFAALLALVATACGSKDEGGNEPAAADQAIERALAGYEQARKLLVADTLDGLAAAAGQIQQAAAEAAEAADGARANRLKELSTAAAALAGKAEGDIEEARRAFGDVSRPLVALLSDDKSLRAGRHLFSCPMAQGYEKWVQPDDKIENPYMGQRMLACGGPAKWK